MRIKIGFDAKRANANNTGLGNYSRFVIDSLAQYFAANSYRMYIPRRKAQREFDALLEQHSSVDYALPQSKLFRGFLSSLWRSSAIVGDLRRDGVELYHGLSNELPFGIAKAGCPSVVTIHDLIYARYPKLFKPIDRWIYDVKFRYACRHSDRIVAVSECTKRDIVSLFGIDPSKVDVIYQGCAEQFAERCTEEHKTAVVAKHNLPERFILNVGTLEERKNLLLCVKALSHLPADIHLVACGRRTAYSDSVEEYARECGLSERVHLRQGVAYADLPALYQLAEAFAYPSHFEGFGIPIIEAQSSRVPVVAATGSCLEEAGGDAALYVDPNDDRGLAESLLSLIEDKELRERSIDLGLRNVQRFTKEKIAQDLEALYKKLI